MTRFAALFLLLFAWVIAPASAQDDPPPWADQQQRLVPSDPAALNAAKASYGVRTALDGDTAVISAPFQTAQGIANRGAVYVFRQIGTTWVEEAAIYPPADDLQALNFGLELALDGDMLVIAEVNGEDDYGRIDRSVVSHPSAVRDPFYDATIYTYKRTGSTWQHVSTLPDFTIHGPGVNEDTFATSIALAGETLAVGAPRTDMPGYSYAGAVHIYQWDGSAWIHDEIITYLEQGSYMFGHDVDLDEAGDTLLVGSSHELNAWIYQFDGTTWHLQSILPSPEDDIRTYGGMVALSPDGLSAALFWLDDWDYVDEHGNWLYFTARDVDMWRSDGAAWVFEQRIHQPMRDQAAEGLGFDLDNESLVTSATWHTKSDQPVRSSAFIYHRIGGQWKLAAELVVFDAADFPLSSHAHRAVSISGGNALAGLVYRSQKSAAFAFEIPGIEQTLDVTRTKNGSALPLPAPPDARADSGFTTFDVSLKTRPTTAVTVQISASGKVLLDVGGVASQTLTLRFTRKNWNVPQTVRARGAAGHAGPLSVQVKQKITSASAIEYLWVKPVRGVLDIPADTFALENPADNALVAAPATLTWRPYALATDYVVRIQRPNGRTIAKLKLKPADVCDANICSVTLDGALLKAGKIYEWRVKAKDKPAKFKRAADWRTFTYMPVQ